MQPQAPQSNSIVLIADAGSVLACGFAAQLAENQYRVDRVEPGDLPVGNWNAAVAVVEHAAAIESLRDALGWWSTPTLVFAATRRLAADVLPLLDERFDLATAADSADVLLWRLQRLVARSRRRAFDPADLDSLTGLFNRRAFEARLRQAIATPAPAQVTGLLYLDLDQFKLINDHYGHVVGDQALRAIGAKLPRLLAPGDTVARLGGDEFGCLLQRGDADSIVRDSRRLLDELARFEVPDLSVDDSPRVTASAGLTLARPGVAGDALLHEVEVAAYHAKDSGRNQLKVYGQLADAARQSSSDMDLQHFETVTRVATERLVDMITLKSRRLVEAAQQEANVCSLTGVYSRRYYDTHLPREFEHARAQGRNLSLALIDVDRFGRINKVYGQSTGDRVLREFGVRARPLVRSSDWIARCGGDEFVIVMPDTALDSAVQVAERVRQAFASAAIEGVDGQRVSATLSVGVVQVAKDTSSVTALVHQASLALKDAKGVGRDPVGAVA
jgi:two-component system, cell cycle response regulator